MKKQQKKDVQRLSVTMTDSHQQPHPVSAVLFTNSRFTAQKHLNDELVLGCKRKHKYDLKAHEKCQSILTKSYPSILLFLFFCFVFLQRAIP